MSKKVLTEKQFLEKWNMSKEDFVNMIKSKRKPANKQEEDMLKDFVKVRRTRQLAKKFFGGLEGAAKSILGDAGFTKFITNEDFFKKNPGYRKYDHPELLEILEEGNLNAANIPDLKEKHPDIAKKFFEKEQNIEISALEKDQREAIKNIASGSIDQPFEIVDPGQQQGTRQSGTANLAENLINTLPISDSAKTALRANQGQLGEGLIQALSEAAQVPGNERLKAFGEQAGPILSQILESAQNYQGFEPQRFGSPTDSRLLGAYDALVNYLQPEQTWYQKAASKISPYTQAGAGILGKLGGEKLAGALGKQAAGAIAKGGLGGAALAGLTSPALLGPLAGLAATLGAGYGINKLATPKGAFSKLGDLIAGDQPNWLQRNILRQKPTGIQKLRGQVGGYISDPGTPGQIRDILGAVQGLYQLGEETGINKYIGKGLNKLGERLGLRLAPSQQQPDYLLGQNIANPLLDSLTARHGAALAAQSQGFFGNQYGYNPQSLRQELQDSLIPAMSQQDIKASNLATRRRRQNLQREALRRQVPLQEQQSSLRDAEQQQRFVNQLRSQGLSEQEQFQRAQLNAMQNRLNREGIIAGQQVNLNRPLERLPRSQPNVGDQLADVLEQNVSRPVLSSFGARLAGGF